MHTRAILLVLVASCLYVATARPAGLGNRRLLDGSAEQFASDGSSLLSTADQLVRVQAAAATGCSSPNFIWPAGSSYCWVKHNSNGSPVGPNSNIFSPANVNVDSTTGELVVQINSTIVKRAVQYTSGEAYLTLSLGFGDYVFVMNTNPANIHQSLVAAPFIYANDSQEFDFEFTRWGDAASTTNSQNVVQPAVGQPAPAGTIDVHRFYLNGVGLTHRLRWSNSSSPNQLLFETFAADGTLLQSYVPSNGNNFVPGFERVHINHWISGSMSSSALKLLPSLSQFRLSCFKFCAINALATCSSPAGVKPVC